MQNTPPQFDSGYPQGFESAPYSSGYAYPGTVPGSGKEQLEQIMDLLYRRKWIIILSFLLVVGGVMAYTLTRVPQYQAHSYVMVDLGSTGPIAGEVVLGSNRPSSVGSLRSLSAELFVLQTSRTMAERVHSRVKEERGGSENDLPSNTNDGVYFPSGYVQFAPASKSVGNAIRVTGTSTMPKDAALLANIYTEEYVQLTQEASRTQITAQRKFLEQQVGERQEELRQTEERVKSYQIREGVIALDQETGYLVSQIAQLEARQDEAQIELQMREASLQSVEDELESINPLLVKRVASGVDRKMRNIETDLADLEAKKAEARLHDLNMTGDDPRLAELNQKIEQLEAEHHQLSQEFVDEVIGAGGTLTGESGITYVTELKRRAGQERIQINGLKSRMRVMNERLPAYQEELNGVPQLSLELARLERDRLHSEQMYQYVIKQLQTVQIAEESEPGYAHILRKATPPSRPVYPDKRRNLFLGLFFGLVAGLALAIARDKLDNRMYKPDELSKKGYNVLGVIPNFKPLIQEDFKGKASVNIEGREISTSLLALLHPSSSITETIRQLRTNVQFSLPDTVIKTLLITSPGTGEGKTTTAVNLALVMAQAGRRTLLIDADMRRPRLHSLFGVNVAPGLSQSIFSKDPIQIEEYKTGIENFYLLPAGKLPTNPAELLGSKRMRDLLSELNSEFDLVIIDTPPVLAATDAVLLSTQADATVVVVRAGETKEGEIDYSVKALQDVGAKIIGLVFNGFDVSKAIAYKYRYRNYTKYGYYAKYGYNTEEQHLAARLERTKSLLKKDKEDAHHPGSV